jgi:hypothetical protein
MMASMRDDGSGNLSVNMMSLFKDDQGALHLSLFSNARSKEYFDKNALDPKLLAGWPGANDPKFQNALNDPSWYMDLIQYSSPASTLEKHKAR